jgi:hypothetical protein
MSKSHQPPRSEFTNLDQKPPTARGGVIARVRISTRQKLNRPLRFMQALTSGQPSGSYHPGVAESQLSQTIAQLNGGEGADRVDGEPDPLEPPAALNDHPSWRCREPERERSGGLWAAITLAPSPWPHHPGPITLAPSPWPHHPGPITLAPSPWPHHAGPITLGRNSPLPRQDSRSPSQLAVPAMVSAGGSGRWR